MDEPFFLGVSVVHGPLDSGKAITHLRNRRMCISCSIGYGAQSPIRIREEDTDSEEH